MGPVLHWFRDLGFWRIIKGYGVCESLILYEIEYSTFFLVLSWSQRELGVNGKKKKNEHTYRRLGGVLSPPVSDHEEYQVLEVLMLCCEQEKKLSDFGVGWSSNSFIFIDQLALCTWGLDFVPIKLLEIYS